MRPRFATQENGTQLISPDGAAWGGQGDAWLTPDCGAARLPFAMRRIHMETTNELRPLFFPFSSCESPNAPTEPQSTRPQRIIYATPNRRPGQCSSSRGVPANFPHAPSATVAARPSLPLRQPRLFNRVLERPSPSTATPPLAAGTAARPFQNRKSSAWLLHRLH